MKKLLFFPCFFLVFSLFFLSSCSKESTSVNTELEELNQQRTAVSSPNIQFTYDDIIVENGMIYFEDEEKLSHFLSFVRQLDDMNAWFDGLEAEKNFNSLRKHYENMLDEINEMESETELLDYVATHNKYWYIDETDADNKELLQKYDLGIHYFLANKNLNYMLNNKLETLPEAKETSFLSEKINGCNTGFVEAIGIKNVKWCKNDRRVKLSLRIVMPNQTNFGIEAGYETFLRGQKKVSCIWVNYKTNLEWRNVSAEVQPSFPNGNPLNPVSRIMNTPNRTGSNTYFISNTIFDLFVKPVGITTSVDIDDVLFATAYGEGSSTGVGNIWATVNCY
ncbi:MAG: hypothetical protein ACPG5B_11610 [Chitinophagales bacterium]